MIMIAVGDMLFDSKGNNVIVEKIDEQYIYVKVTSKSHVSFNNKKKIEIHEVNSTKIYSINDIGISLFFKLDDIIKHKNSQICDERYYFNKNNILAYFDSEKYKLLLDIKKYIPYGSILSNNLKEKLIKTYYLKDISNDEEKNFYKQNKQTYFARIDLDTYFYRDGYKDIYNEHFYDKIYISKNEKFKIIDKGVFLVNWAAPIAKMYYDNEKVRLTRNYYVDVYNESWNATKTLNSNNIYEHELLLKRNYRFNPLKYYTKYIYGDNLYSEGSMDDFLVDVMLENRSKHNITDIIKSIQNNQNKIIRENEDTNIIIQGCAGSGKTMILFHRLSYLKFNNMLHNLDKVQIITPNKEFSSYFNDLNTTLDIENINKLTMFDYYFKLAYRYQNSFRITSKEELDINDEVKKYFEDKKDFIEAINIDQTIISKYYNVHCFKYIRQIYKNEINDFLRLIHFSDLISYSEKLGLDSVDIKKSKMNKIDYINDLCHNLLIENNTNCKKLDNINIEIRNKEKKHEDTSVDYIEKERLESLLLTEFEISIINSSIQVLKSKYSLVLNIFNQVKNYFRNEYNIISESKIYGRHELLILIYLYYLHCNKINNNDLYLFIDEGQDYSLIEYKILRIINSEKCVFNIFGDIDQCINSNIGIKNWQILNKLFKSKYFILKENYRNTIEITNYVNDKIKFDMNAIGIHGVQVSEICYDDIEEIISNELAEEDNTRIAIISMNKSFIMKMKNRYINNTVYIGDVSSVKGLEFEIAVVDINTMMSKSEKYISLTRSLNKLFVIQNKLDN